MRLAADAVSVAWFRLRFSGYVLAVSTESSAVHSVSDSIALMTLLLCHLCARHKSSSPYSTQLIDVSLTCVALGSVAESLGASCFSARARRLCPPTVGLVRRHTGMAFLCCTTSRPSTWLSECLTQLGAGAGCASVAEVPAESSRSDLSVFRDVLYVPCALCPARPVLKPRISSWLPS